MAASEHSAGPPIRSDHRLSQEMHLRLVERISGRRLEVLQADRTAALLVPPRQRFRAMALKISQPIARFVVLALVPPAPLVDVEDEAHDPEEAHERQPLQHLLVHGLRVARRPLHHKAPNELQAVLHRRGVVSPATRRLHGPDHFGQAVLGQNPAVEGGAVADVDLAVLDAQEHQDPVVAAVGVSDAPAVVQLARFPCGHPGLLVVVQRSAQVPHHRHGHFEASLLAIGTPDQRLAPQRLQAL
mmetsp:Transcript_531/g.1927  ORF Transcript_531/g.1927 Transcript_531/m.1927 type:complete len:243 (+) Transcript_531:548-1276(+)